jgi:predicted RNA-binding protein
MFFAFYYNLMQLKRLTELLEQFKKHLLESPTEASVILWETQQLFQNNWDTEAPHFAGMFRQSLENSVSRRYWSRELYAPREMMLEFIALDEEMVRIMFRDLFNENKEVEGRMDRFVFYCNEMLQAYKSNHQRPPHNRHYHDDNYNMVSLYLAFRFPDRYAPYEHEAFTHQLRLLHSPDIPLVNDPARWFKVSRTLLNLMKKDPELTALHAQRLQPERHYAEESLLLAYEFCIWSSNL